VEVIQAWSIGAGEIANCPGEPKYLADAPGREAPASPGLLPAFRALRLLAPP